MPLLQTRSVSSSARRGAQFGEVCGATTAECAAICCCCPCGLAKFLLLVVYKVPAGLCRLALRKKRRRKLKKKGLLPQRRFQCVCDDKLPIELDSLGEEEKGEKVDALLELENEMRDWFYGGGFWRSSSQREPVGDKQNEPISVN